MTVVCITGMHRSGTSLVARALNLLGLYLGPDEKIMQFASDNPEGYWENIDFVRTNDSILSAFGGAWDVPPDLPSNWTSSDRLSPTKHATMQLLAQFKDKEPWGWKDPRTSLTLPYWQELIPNLKIVVVVRNPLDIFLSLGKRGYSSLAFGAHLTTCCFRSIFAATTPENRIVTHYDVFFHKPEDELQRLVEYVGLETSPEAIKEACASISQDIHHHHSTLADLVHSDAPLDLIEDYVYLCKEAGPDYKSVFTTELEAGLPTSRPASNPDTWGIAVRTAKISFEKSKLISNADNEILRLRGAIYEKDLQILQLREMVSESEEMIEKLDIQLRKKENDILLLFNRLGEQERTIDRLSKFSLSFQIRKFKQSVVEQKIVQVLVGHRATLAPPGSTREKIAKRAKHWLRAKT